MSRPVTWNSSKCKEIHSLLKHSNHVTTDADPGDTTRHALQAIDHTITRGIMRDEAVLHEHLDDVSLKYLRLNKKRPGPSWLILHPP